MTTTSTQFNQDDKVRALANYLQIKYSESEELIENRDWLVLSEEEREKEVYDIIEFSLWAFNYKFLSSLYRDTIGKINEDEWIMISSRLCEDFNPIVKAMVDLDFVVTEAVGLDGYGHFLSTYDGLEIDSDMDCTCNLDQTYYMYRNN